jgi:hypothetical protein
MVPFNELSSENISFIANHIVIFLLLSLLLLGGLDNFLHVIYMILLIFYHFFVTLDLGFGSILVSFYLDILSLDFLIVLIKLHKFLILVLYFLSQLLHCIGHSFILLL